jgi:hypothetical protein
MSRLSNLISEVRELYKSMKFNETLALISCCLSRELEAIGRMEQEREDAATVPAASPGCEVKEEKDVVAQMSVVCVLVSTLAHLQLFSSSTGNKRRDARASGGLGRVWNGESQGRELGILMDSLERMLVARIAQGVRADGAGEMGGDWEGDAVCVTPLVSLFYPFQEDTLLKIARHHFSRLGQVNTINTSPSLHSLLRHVSEPWQGRRLRIGIMSADFGANSVGRELMALLHALPPDVAWVSCISLGHMGRRDARGDGSQVTYADVC